MSEQAEREMTFGEKAVGQTFNPSGDTRVGDLKVKAAAFIDACHALRGEGSDKEVGRMASIAITEAQTAQMWAVKAATWK
jgi:RecA/RadA recombinase